MPLPSPRCCMYCAPHHASLFQPYMILTPSLDLCWAPFYINVKLSDPSVSSCPCWWAGSSKHNPACTFCLSSIPHSTFPAATEALVVWQQGLKEPAPCAPDSSHQRAWDGPLVTAAAEALVRNAPDELAHARLLASLRKESGKWLYTGTSLPFVPQC